MRSGPGDAYGVWTLGSPRRWRRAAAFWPAIWSAGDVLASFPNAPSLAERGAQDGVGSLYVRMFQRAELVTTGGEATDIGEFLSLARERFGAPSAIAADRWRASELRDILKRLRFPVVPFAERGQGFKDGG